jgi:hypothetical protein
MRIPSLEGRDRKLDRAAIAAVFVFVATFSVVGIATAQMVATTSSIRIAPTTTDVLPEVAMDDNGDFLVVWRDLSRDMSMEPGPAHTDIFARRYDATGTALGKQFVVNNYTTGNQSEPEVVFIPGSNAGAASGSFAVVWSGTDSEYGGIFGNIVNGDDSLLLSMDIPLTSEADSQSAPSVAASDSGFVVVWSENYLTGGSSIRGRSFGLNGIPVGLDTLLVPGGDRASPEVALAPNGDFVVAYSFFQYLPMFQSHEDIRAQRFDSFFVAQGTEILVNDFTIDNQRNPLVRMRDNGEFLITWDNGDQAVPYFQEFAANGNKTGCPAQGSCERQAAEIPMPNEIPVFKPLRLDVALASNGGFATVYETFDSGPGARIDGLLFDYAGDVVDSDPFDLNSDDFVVHDSEATQIAARNPSIASNRNGTFVVAYDDTDYFVAVRLFGGTTPTATLPPMCGDPNGNGVTTATEALLALQTSVGGASCPLCACDVDNSGDITATDALRMLFASVGIIVNLVCPACP